MKQFLLFIFLFSVLSLNFSYTQNGNSPENAIPVTPGTHTANNSNGSQWFLYIPATDKKVKISTCGLTTENTYFIVYDSAFNWISYSDNDCNLQSEKTFIAKGGKKHYICWANFYTSGTYQWILEETDPIPGEYCENAITAVSDTNFANHSNGIEQWFKFTATKTGKIVISTCNLTNVFTYANIYRGCNYSGYIYKNENFCGNGQITISFPSFEGETYYIQWQNLSNSSYKWTLKEENSAPGEFCENALTATIGTNIANNNNGNQWFKYTASKNCKIVISDCNSETNFPVTASFFRDCSHGWVQYFEKTCNNNNNKHTYTIKATQGITYYIQWKSSYQTGDYSWTLNEVDYQPGESCSNPTIAQKGLNTAVFSIGEQWFVYTPSKDCKVVISNCGSAITDAYPAIFGGCNNEFVNYYTENCGSNLKAIFNGEQGKNYYIRWTTPSQRDTMNWKLEEYEYQAGEICNTAIQANIDTNIADLSQRTQWFKFTTTINGKLVISNCGSNATSTYLEIFENCEGKYASYRYQNCGDQIIVTIDNIEPGETYYLKWYTYNYNQQPFKWTIRELDYQPGELCETAITANAGINNADLTNGIQWFKYTATKNGNIVINNCGSGVQNVYVQIYNNCNDGWMYYDIEDCGDQIIAKFQCIQGQTYYISWNTWNAPLNFQWTLEELDPLPGQFCTNALPATKGENNVDHSSLQIIWLSYTPETTGKVIIETECDNVTEYLSIYVLDTCLINLEENNAEQHIIALKENFCQGNPSLSFESIAGQTYYIISVNWDGGEYNFTLSEGIPEPGEFCSSPITAIQGTNHVNFNNGQFQWFEYTAQNSGKITIDVECDMISENSAIGVITECIPIQLIPDKAIFLKKSICEPGLPNSFYCQQGVTYKIIWYNPYGGEHDWTLNEQPAMQGEFCEYPLIAHEGINHSNHDNSVLLWYEYTATNNGTLVISAECNEITENTYMAIFNNCVSLQQIEDSALAMIEGFCEQNEVRIPCKAGKTYKILFYNPLGQEYDWTLTEIIPYPGEICENPLTAIVGENTSKHTNSLLQWFEFTPDRDATIIISASCSNFPVNTHMAVIENCMPIEEIRNNAIVLVENFCNQTSQVQFEAKANKKYIIGWYNQNQAIYTWNLTVQTTIQKTSLTSDVKLFPNPNNGIFTLQVSDEFINSELTITGLNGQVLYNHILSKNNNEINLQQFKPGIYMLIIRNGKNVVREKLIIN